ncbi:MAG: DUF2846 domain-containing protein [Burkholderiales bacterium]|nr:DUF2846 domain-containing protein [Burkholderiales bacterium]
MIPSHRIVLLGALCAISVLSGCGGINKAPAEADAEAKKFRSDPAAAQVYPYRNVTMGAGLPMPVTVDGKLAGNTGPNSYFKFDLPAGKHTFTLQGDKSSLDVDTGLGKSYYIWQEVKMGVLSGGSKLQLVSEEIGR